MAAGEQFFESLSPGVITQAELDWLLRLQDRLTLNAWIEPVGRRRRSSLPRTA